MPKLTYTCPLCGKQLKLKEEIEIGNEKLYSYECGHTFATDLIKVDAEALDFTSKDGSTKIARDYQKDGIKFIIESDFNCIIGDQMRLGKTPQSLLALANRLSERTPCLILVKSANIWQWVREYKTWTSQDCYGIYVIQGGQAFVPAGFSTYICSMDTFSLNPRCKCGHTYHEDKCNNKKCMCRIYEKTTESVRDKLKKIPFKLVIADEAHSFKNTDSNRSQALTDFIQFLNTGEESREIKFTCTRCKHEWMEIGKQKYDKRIGHTVIAKTSKCPTCGQYCYCQQQHQIGQTWTQNPDAVEKVTKLLALGRDQSTTEHERKLALEKAEEIKKEYNVKTEEQKPCGLVLLTGTPILNRAEEYFVPLNLVAPEKFPSLDRFRRQWLQQDSKGRFSRVQNWRLAEFKETIKSYLLRREKEDVYSDLPVLNKIYTLIEADTEKYKKEYNRVLDKMDMQLADKANPSFWDMQDSMMALRRICGMMKISHMTETLEEATAEDSKKKYAIGIHHESVRDLLYLNLGSDKNCYKLSGEDSAESKDRIMVEWEHSDKQFLIVNMLAGGVGMDFHYCDEVYVLERQWNSEMETQFEFRFYNPDKSIKQNPTNVEYIIARGTLDEWWYDMVESKRRVVGETQYNHWNIQQDQGTFQELLHKTLQARL